MINNLANPSYFFALLSPPILRQNKEGSGDASFAPVKEVTQFLVVHARSSKVFFPIYFPIGCYATCTMFAYIVSHINVKSFLNCYVITYIFAGDETERTGLFSLAFEHQCYQSGCHFFLSLLVSFLFNLILTMNILNVYAAALLLTSFHKFYRS